MNALLQTFDEKFLAMRLLRVFGIFSKPPTTEALLDSTCYEP